MVLKSLVPTLTMLDQQRSVTRKAALGQTGKTNHNCIGNAFSAERLQPLGRIKQKVPICTSTFTYTQMGSRIRNDSNWDERSLSSKHAKVG